MTREEARQKIDGIGFNGCNKEAMLAVIEALGLLKFDEVKSEVIVLWRGSFPSLGVVRLEEWPEGLVLWVGGKIRYRSWG